MFTCVKRLLQHLYSSSPKVVERVLTKAAQIFSSWEALHLGLWEAYNVRPNVYGRGFREKLVSLLAPFPRTCGRTLDRIPGSSELSIMIGKNENLWNFLLRNYPSRLTFFERILKNLHVQFANFETIGSWNLRLVVDWGKSSNSRRIRFQIVKGWKFLLHAKQDAACSVTKCKTGVTYKLTVAAIEIKGEFDEHENEYDDKIRISKCYNSCCSFFLYLTFIFWNYRDCWCRWTYRHDVLVVRTAAWRRWSAAPIASTWPTVIKRVRGPTGRLTNPTAAPSRASSPIRLSSACSNPSWLTATSTIPCWPTPSKYSSCWTQIYVCGLECWSERVLDGNQTNTY